MAKINKYCTLLFIYNVYLVFIKGNNNYNLFAHHSAQAEKNYLSARRPLHLFANDECDPSMAMMMMETSKRHLPYLLVFCKNKKKMGKK